MNTPSRHHVGLGLLLAVLAAAPGCSKASTRRAAGAAGAGDAVFLGLLDEVMRSWDETRGRQAIAKVAHDPRYVAPLLAVLADRDHRCLVAAIRCAGAEGGDPIGYDGDLLPGRPEGEVAEAAAAPATVAMALQSEQFAALLSAQLRHRESKCRQAALEALTKRGQLPAFASELLEDADSAVRAAAIAACLQLAPPPWPELGAALLSLTPAQAAMLRLEPEAAEQLGQQVSHVIDWRDSEALQQQLPLLARLTLPATAIDGLVATLARGDEALVGAVLTFLAERGGALTDAQPVLRMALARHQPSKLRLAAFACLESCQAPVVDELQAALRGLDATLRIAAARVMIRAGSRAGIDALCNLVQDGDTSGQQARLLLCRLAGASTNTPLAQLRARLATHDLRNVRLP